MRVDTPRKADALIVSCSLCQIGCLLSSAGAKKYGSFVKKCVYLPKYHYLFPFCRSSSL
jgi:hypothetical protein